MQIEKPFKVDKNRKFLMFEAEAEEETFNAEEASTERNIFFDELTILVRIAIYTYLLEGII